MKRPFLPSLALFLFLLPQGGSASMFDLFFEDAKNARPSVYPSSDVKFFISKELVNWGERGLGGVDVNAAIDGRRSTLCSNNVDKNGDPIDISAIGSEDKGCLGLQKDILSMVDAEKEINQLGNDLLAISNGSELSISDEPHRPVSVGALSLSLKRAWGKAEADLIPWDYNDVALQDRIDDLNKALNGLGPPGAQGGVILAFHHGYFRDDRERDPRFQSLRLATNPTAPVAIALKKLAEKLGITGDETAVGEFATPNLQVPNVALWARKDDLGLQWIYPVSAQFSPYYPHFPNNPVTPEYILVEDYPALADVSNALSLAYPFEYEGTLSPSGKARSPLCSRTVGREGYLCRRMPSPLSDCTNDAQDNISLVECGEPTVTETDMPSICPDSKDFHDDTGAPLDDPTAICSPDKKIIYEDGISAHACYIGLCLAQSMSGHTLIPNRNPVVANEGTSPYASCVRADPQLGLYAEAAAESPYPLPTYIGHLLTQDFDREYCLKTGDAPRPTLGDCAFRSDQVVNTPSFHQATETNTIVTEATRIATSQEDFLSLAVSIGQRASLDQTITIEKKLFATLAQFIRQMADLLTELKRAPITTTACPWTGPFKKFGP